MSMAAAAASAEEQGVGGGYDDDDVTISVDDFLSILNEDDDQDHKNSHFNPDQFCSVADNDQAYGTATPVGNEGSLFSMAGYDAASGNFIDTTGAVNQYICPSSSGMILSASNEPSYNSSLNAVVPHLPNMVEPNCYPSNWYREYLRPAASPSQSVQDGLNCGFTQTFEEKNGMKIDVVDYEAAWSDNKSFFKAPIGDATGGLNATEKDVPLYDFFQKSSAESIHSHPVVYFDSLSTYDSSSSTTTDEASAEPFRSRLPWNTEQTVEMRDEKINEATRRCDFNVFALNKDATLRGSSSGSGPTSFLGSTRLNQSSGLADGLVYSHSPSINEATFNMALSREPVQFQDKFAAFGDSCLMKAERDCSIVQSSSLKIFQESILASSSEDRNKDNDDDDDNEDDDLCIIEDMSQPKQFNSSRIRGKPFVTSQHSAMASQSSASVASFDVGVSGTKLKATDERFIFEAILQDLSESITETTPPDGLMSVSLLRHQRIALSWMTQKEKNKWPVGGILADDQGLGKTVSTIALILTERPPRSKSLKAAEQSEPEAVDLDEEDDINQTRNSNSETCSSRGRPSGGTLIVCPTSVLRQWAEELRTKVTKRGNISVLVYHGSHRTKDPLEVAKYDVVLTTYSIVSMEVPKQSLAGKNCNGKRKPEADAASNSTTSKRKHRPPSDKKLSKRAINNALLESAGRPLANVGWFRVVLDEAQCIKNFRTQVAQACWGLRAKRRWCLSGTPIQNSIDDLYSYFRFLRLDPYSIYNTFCVNIKFPINKNPSTGYRKLQALLKHVMLRRTKGTLLDGKPIINLPPKHVKLVKVEFSDEERDFYTKLAADSLAQFQAYAESGTVKQNYVNILLMLLRLRQACCHPLLVRGCDTSLVVKSSIHMAKKLSRDQQICLLNCLEASLAICRICNDPPEDAVVSICGHVFCNQCISERLTGDERECPATNCKAQLTVSSIFTKTTLKSCLDQSIQDGSHTYSAPESSDQSDLVEPEPTDRFDSSKIKAALKVLKALAKPRISESNNVIEEHPRSNTADVDKSCASSAHDTKNCDMSNGASSVKGEKAIVFSQWTRMLDLLESCLKESSIQYRRLDGTMSVVARDKAVRDFNTLPEVSVMIMSLKAASLGLNMVAACHVLLLDLWWNPTTEDQAIDRAHRIGQTRPVTVVRLTVRDTVEDRILALQQKKRELVASAFGEDEAGCRQTRLSEADLKYLFMG